MFSRRVPASLAPNRLTVAVAEARAAGRPIIDLTLSNPTVAGFSYPDGLLARLSSPDALTYAPDPAGSLRVRRAVADEYARRGTEIRPDRIVVTASTSEAYSLLFKVFCDPGDEVLIPRPSYPLFDHLTRLESVAAVGYRLEYQGRWSIDLPSIESALSPRTRVLLLVSPNNPTGSFVSSDELAWLLQLCASREIVIVSDEVFADYELRDDAAVASGRVLDREDALVFSLGGLSKSIGLPQVKLAWLGVGGPATLIEDALERIELAADTYLTVSTPVQVAAPELLRQGTNVRRQIQSRIRANYEAFKRAVESVASCRVLQADGGWYAVIQVPSIQDEEDLVVDLVTRDGVLAHPGYFFDFERPSYLVVSLLCPEIDFREGIDRVLSRFDAAPAA